VADGGAGLVTIPLKAVAEIEPVTVKSETEITVTLPSPPAAGNWTLRVFNNNEYDELTGAVTFSESEIYEIQRQKKAVIVAGGGGYPGNALWKATQMCANYAYLALLSQGYTREQIYYLTPEIYTDIRGEGINDADGDATKSNFSYAINTWSEDAEELLIYMTDHGGNGIFYLNRTVTPEEIITAQELDKWLDSLQNTMSGKIIFIYDACLSGTFLPLLTPPPGKEESRILISSSSADEWAWFMDSGKLSFSWQFWATVFFNAKLYDAFSAGKSMMAADQTSLLEADGDGIPNTKNDKSLAGKIIIGRGRTAASVPPQIGGVSEEQTLENGETAATLRAVNVSPSGSIARVWAVIIPPDYSQGAADVPVTNLPVAELEDTDNDGTYEAVYENFGQAGIYKIIIYAEDTQGVCSLPVQTAVIQTEGKAVVKGDLSGNWSLDLPDAVIVLKVLAGMSKSGLAWSDYAASGTDANGDGKAGFEELFYILKTVSEN
jgi:hypothetical protein